MAETHPQSNPSEEELQDQIALLQKDLAKAKANNQALWMLLDEISERIQISLAGIKAAVTSLLDYDILWDGATKHDFLEIIEDNVDMVSKKIVLFTIASKNQTDKLELVLEPNSIEEILSHVVDVLMGEYPACNMDLVIAENGKPILVDFEYMSMALILLLEIFVEIHSDHEECRIEVDQFDDRWIIKILGLSQEFKDLFSDLPQDLTCDQVGKSPIIPTNKLKLFILDKLLKPQHICMEIGEKGDVCFIQLLIPMVAEI